jgi:hypothetical protein
MSELTPHLGSLAILSAGVGAAMGQGSRQRRLALRARSRHSGRWRLRQAGPGRSASPAWLSHRLRRSVTGLELGLALLDEGERDERPPPLAQGRQWVD